MVKIPLGQQDYKRSIAKEPHVFLFNRFFEKNPTLTDDQVALLTRPRLKKFINVGTAGAAIRPRLYSCPGSFDNDAFVIPGNAVYRLSTLGVPTHIGDITGAANRRNAVSLVATGSIGSTPEYLFLADGSALWLYIANSYALGTLTASGAVANSDVVKMDTTYYEFTNGSVDAGTPAGTVGDPWLIALGAGGADALTNLYDAIGLTGIAGTAYSTGTLANPTINQSGLSATTVTVRAGTAGTAGNALPTTETGANIAWGGTTLAGGGSGSFTQVPMPDDRGAISVDYIAEHVIVVPAQGEGVNGRFYWIDPGETVIDPLNFATAERSPDPIFQVIVFGDKFMLPGKSTTETWFMTGDPLAPVQRYQGILFDRGTVEGCAVQIKEAMVMVDENGAVFHVSDGIKRISTPDIEQRLRNAIQFSNTFV